MSKSTFYKLAVLIILLLPATGKAADLKFDGKTWTVDVKMQGTAQNVIVRNEFELKDVAAKMLLGKEVVIQKRLLNQSTLEQIEKAMVEINRPALSSKLVIENDWAKEFEPGQLGQALDLYELRNRIFGNAKEVDLPVLISYPKTTLGETNSMGINELVAIGESDFSGSSKNRITNITVGSAKYNGLILKPGEEFSFNKYLGDVDAANGFKPEIVIKREGLVPEFGGGLCQVSSTAFRAAMNGGMPIKERKNHAFAVRYYSPAGSDATIYSPVVDLKFVNDYPSHLLVRTRMQGTKLFYEYYGTKDDRQIVLEGPVQYDRKSDGSLKAVWTKKVTKNGLTDVQEFRSNYVSPNLYQKVATVQSNTPANPPTGPTPAPTPAPEPAPTPPPTT